MRGCKMCQNTFTVFELFTTEVTAVVLVYQLFSHFAFEMNLDTVIIHVPSCGCGVFTFRTRVVVLGIPLTGNHKLMTQTRSS